MLRIPPRPPEWLREQSGYYNAWFAILLPTVGVLCIIKGGTATRVGWETIGFGLLNLLFVVLTWSNRPWAAD